MPVQVSANQTASCLGQSFSVDNSIEADNAAIASPSVPRAKVGTLSARTDNDTGTLTLEASHGVTTGATNKIDVYWEGGKRVGMTVGTVAGNDVPIDGGSGDNLPLAATAITAMVPQKEDFNAIGNNVVAILAKAAARATIKLQTSAPVVELTINIEAANVSYIWNSDTGLTNPIAGDTIASVLLSHADGVNARQVTCVAPFN